MGIRLIASTWGNQFDTLEKNSHLLREAGVDLVSIRHVNGEDFVIFDDETQGPLFVMEAVVLLCNAGKLPGVNPHSVCVLGKNSIAGKAAMLHSEDRFSVSYERDDASLYLAAMNSLPEDLKDKIDFFSPNLVDKYEFKDGVAVKRES